MPRVVAHYYSLIPTLISQNRGVPPVPEVFFTFKKIKLLQDSTIHWHNYLSFSPIFVTNAILDAFVP